MSLNEELQWQPEPHPDWLAGFNLEADAFDMQQLLPLDAQSLIDGARRHTGLEEFGAGPWRDALECLCRALEEEAELHFMGRMMARQDLLLWLCNRLHIEELYRRHPEIEEQAIEAPVFITGLPRSGTSILYELLALHPEFRVPASWEVLFPLAHRASEQEQKQFHHRAHRQLTQWNRVAPSFSSMHEMGADIPAECGLLMCHGLISDHIASLHQTPSYDQILMSADMEWVYGQHRRLLKVLQWQKPGRWLLKAPAHQVNLPSLFAVYPDAKVIQTHRDPIKSMGSSASLLGTLLRMRSDKSFDSSAFSDTVLAEAVAERLERVMDQRAEGLIPDAQIIDSRYCDLIDDAPSCLSTIYQSLALSFEEEHRAAVESYLANKPKGKFGQHTYQTAQDEAMRRARASLARYQQSLAVPNEC